MMIQESGILNVLEKHVSPLIARSILRMSVRRANVDLCAPHAGDNDRLVHQLQRGVQLYVHDQEARRTCVNQLADLLARGTVPPPAPEQDRLRIPINLEVDVMVARKAGRDTCQNLGFSTALQVKVATAISELARNIVQYAGTGAVEIAVLRGTPPGVEVVARDEGPGIPDVQRVLSGQYRSMTGMGMGLRGTRNLMDFFEIRTSPEQGTEVKVRAFLR
jgi:serine/threonine-protein kinase RsbT